MKENKTVAKIFKVFEGEFKTGYLRRTQKRESAAFVYYLSGKADYIFEGYRLQANTDKFFYLCKNALYDIQVHEPSKFICIDFDFLETEEETSEIFSVKAAAVKNEFEKALKLWTEKNLWYQSDVFSVTYGLYSQAIKRSHERYTKTNEKFYPVIEFVLKNYTRSDFTVKEIADFAGVCEVQLRRIFKSLTNASPNRYVNFLRLEKAKNMLLESNLTVEEISRAVGIEDPYYFSRLFKKELGLPPTAFRKK